MSKPKPPAETIFKWLRENLGKSCLAPLTGTDAKALSAATQIMLVYAYTRDPCCIEAYALMVMLMQQHTRELAYHGIAHVMDWSDRATVWQACGFNPLLNPRKCKYES